MQHIFQGSNVIIVKTLILNPFITYLQKKRLYFHFSILFANCSQKALFLQASLTEITAVKMSAIEKFTFQRRLNLYESCLPVPQTS